MIRLRAAALLAAAPLIACPAPDGVTDAPTATASVGGGTPTASAPGAGPTPTAPSPSATAPSPSTTQGGDDSPTAAPTPSAPPTPTSTPTATATAAPMPTALVINEALSDNETGLTTAAAEHPDWIELYNGGPSPVSLAGLGLSDDPSEPFKLRLPAVIVPAGGFALIYASGEEDAPGDELHAPFKLSAGGEWIGLTHATGGEVDSLTLPALSADVSLGRSPDGGAELRLFDVPTPGAPNGVGTGLPAEAPVFSDPGGYYGAGLSLSLSAQEGAAVRYTLDGSDPTESSPLYSAPLELASRAGTANDLSEIPTNHVVNDGNAWKWKPPKIEVDKVWVVRARAFAAGRAPSPAVTHTYLVDPASPERYAFTVVSLATDREGLFSDATGIYVPGDSWLEAQDAGYSGGDSTHPANYHNEGDAWERPAHLEIFEPGGALALSFDAGIRIHGNTSRAYPFKSLRIYLRSSYGPSSVEYPLFADQEVDRFSRLILRNSGGDFAGSLLRDAFNQAHLRGGATQLDTQAYRPTVLFINGEYWGIHNLRERFDEDYLAEKYDLDPDDVIILRDNAQLDEGQPGDEASFLALRQLIETGDLDDPQVWASVSRQMDLDNFIDYNLAQIWMQNLDWPDTNVKMWRLRVDPVDSGAHDAEDGRWRWHIFDTDHTLHDPAHDTLSAATSPSPASGQPWSTVMLRRLLENEDFAARFVTRYADALNTFLSPEAVGARLTAMAAVIDPAIRRQVNRWQYPGGYGGWQSRIEEFRAFTDARADYMRGFIADYFGLEGAAALTLTADPPEGGRLRVNTVTLPAGTGSWQGIYFLGMPITVEALPARGWRVAGWEGASEGGAAVTLDLDGDRTLGVTFEPAPCDDDCEDDDRRGP